MSGLKTIAPVVLGVIASSVYSLYQWHVPLSSAESEIHLQQLIHSNLIPDIWMLGFRTGALVTIVSTSLYVLFDPVGVRLNARKLDGSEVQVHFNGLRRFVTFTTWSWILQGVYFGLVTVLQLRLMSNTSSWHTFAIEWAEILFELNLSVAMLVSSVVTYVLIPSALKAGMNVNLLLEIPALLMHNANLLFMVSEVLFNQVEVRMHHFPFVLLYGCAYTVFSWIYANQRGGFFVYFFLNYNYEHALVAYLALLTVLGSSFYFTSFITHLFNPEDNIVAVPILLAATGALMTLRVPQQKDRRK